MIKDLRGKNLRGANLLGANLIGADLSGAIGIMPIPVADPRYWRDRDPEFVRQVSEGYRRLYP
jgi:hypothetical protein